MAQDDSKLFAQLVSILLVSSVAYSFMSLWGSIILIGLFWQFEVVGLGFLLPIWWSPIVAIYPILKRCGYRSIGLYGFILTSLIPLGMFIYSFVIYVIKPDAEGIDLAMTSYLLCSTLWDSGLSCP